MKVNKYLKVLSRIIKMSFMKTMMYRSDFLFGTLTTMLWLLMQIFFTILLFGTSQVKTIGGLTQNQMLFGLWFMEMLTMPFFFFVIRNVRNIMKGVNEGKLDFFFLKPLNTSFNILLQEVDASGAHVILFYTIIGIVIFCLAPQEFLDWRKILLGIYVYVTSGIIQYALFVIVASLNFYSQNFLGGWWLMVNSQDLQRYPRQIYPAFIQIFLTTIFPIFLIINPIFNIMTQTFDLQLGLHIALVALIFTIIARTIWLNGLRRYESAN